MLILVVVTMQCLDVKTVYNVFPFRPRLQNIDNQATSNDRKERKTSQEAEVEQLDFRHVLTRHVQTKQKPCFLSELTTLRVREGEQAVFECHVEGIPEPNIAWAVNGKPIKESKYFQMSYDGKTDAYNS